MSDLLSAAAHEWRRRTIDGVKLFRPMRGMQEEFFRCKASECLVRGGNRSGKSVCVSTRFAAIARDMSITCHDGTTVSARLPHQKGRPLLMWCIGFDQKHVGQTLYRLLFRAGLYRIIRDGKTGEWRAWDPTREEDAGRRAETKLSPPLIPETDIEEIAWVDKKARIFEAVTLKNGTIICAYSSQGEVKAGDPVDEIWIDEAIANSAHYPEWQARLSDEKGRLVWSSWPKRDNPALREITRRAKAKKENPTSPDDVAEFVLRFSDNKHIDPEERAKRIAGWSEEDRIARDEGEYALDSLRMYPTFSKHIHYAWGELPEGDDRIAKILRERRGRPPEDWTRMLVLDPGTANPAVLACAVPPPADFGDALVAYREVYPGRCDADTLAAKVSAAFFGEWFEWFVIDGHAARHTPMGFGGTVGGNYSRAFRAQGLACRTSGSAFMPGSDDVESRIHLLQKAMAIRSDGTPYLRIVVDQCPHLCKQLEEYERAEREGPQGIVQLDLPAANQKIDVAVCLDEETQVLTKAGWTHFRNLSGQEQLATVNLVSNKIEYQVPSRLIKNQYSGDMFRFGGHKLDAMVTPEHRMVVYGHRDDESPVVRQAQDLHAWDRVKLHAQWDGRKQDVAVVPKVDGGKDEEKYCDPGDLAEFLGWYISEGSCRKTIKCPGSGYGVTISQVKPQTTALLGSLLNRLPWKFTSIPQGFVSSRKQLWHYVMPFGENCYTKRVPQWIKDADTEVIRRFLIGAVLGDGWARSSGKGRSYCTSNPLLADDIQELFMKLGTTASVTCRPGAAWKIRGREGVSRDIFVVSEWTHPRAGLRNHAFEPNYRTEKYEGVVYCACVPNTTLIVRRNGRPMITGNCLEYAISRNPTYVVRSIQSLRGKTPVNRSYERWAEEREEKAQSQSVHCGVEAAYANAV